MIPRIGFLGCGWIGRLRLAALNESGVASIKALVEPEPNARALAQDLAKGAVLCETLERLLEHELDGVVVSTPNFLHAEQARNILRMGISVFCQKPVGRNAAETAAVVDTARSYDRLLSSDLSYRFTSGMSRVREVVQANAIGEIFAVDSCFHNSFGPDKHWYYDLALAGGGCVMDLGLHLIDLVLWVLNFPSAHDVRGRLFARGKPLDAGSESLIEDYAVASIGLDNDVHLAMSCSWNQPTGGDAFVNLVFRGTRGSVQFRNIGGSFYDFAATMYSRGHSVSLADPPDDWGGRAIVNWASRLADGARFNEHAAELTRVAEIIDLIYLNAFARDI